MALTFKRHWKWLVLLALVLAALTVGMGNLRIIAYTVPGRLQVVGQGANYGSSVALFDESVVHHIEILISDGDYEQMRTTYRQTGLKDYFHADVIIDGVRVNNVGLRLKGNASLRTALGGGMGPGGRGQRAPRGEWMPQFDPQNMPQFDPGNLPQLPGDGQRPPFPDGQMPDPGNLPFQPGQGGFFGGQGGDGSKLPFMIKFDRFVSGQSYQGYTNLAIRTYGISNDAAMLQEPVTNDVVRLVGLPATLTAYASVRVNGEAEQLYTISEVINQDYVDEHFANSDGVLYKAELGSTLSYAGEDPSAYAQSFTQQTRINDADLAPLIAFARFLSESDDATFEQELPTHLDVEAFATYLAVNNLLVNTDSIVGMGNNYYLYYDNVAERFTLLMWDANESLGKLGGGTRAAEYDLYTSGGGGMMRGPMGGGSNTLVQRFMANATFKALYEAKLREVYEQAFLGGAITQQVERYAAVLRQANGQGDLVEPSAYEQAVASVLDFVQQRSAYLATTPLLGDLTEAAK